jgi:hypothetical protein
MKIKLYFTTDKKDNDIIAVQLKCDVSFLGLNNLWSEPEPAIIDTGAYISMIPSRIWKTCKKKIVAENYLPARGIVKKQECQMPVKLGVIIANFQDKTGNEKELEIRTLFAQDMNTDYKAPLLIGCFDVMTDAILYSDYTQNKAFLDFRG